MPANALAASPFQFPVSAASSLFQSFIWGGFECSHHLNSQGIRLDLIASTRHDISVRNHYSDLREIGILTARDGIRWHLVDTGTGYDFSSLEPMLAAAQEIGIQVIWDLCHYGWPLTIHPLHPDFVSRFADYAAAVGRFFAPRIETTQLFTPMNEISFLTWALGVGCIHPHLPGKDREIKEALIRATMRSMDALRAELPSPRFIQGEPAIHVLPRPDAGPEEVAAARLRHEGQFETWDLLSGRDPSVGGSARYLDLIGINYYHSNQWIIDGPRILWDAEPPDPRWRPLHGILLESYQRYGRPLVISETSHFGSGRVQWFRGILDEVEKALSLGLPLQGVCLYPIVDRHDWDDLSHWHRSGVWDVRISPDGSLAWELHEEYAAAIRDAAGRFQP